MASRKTLAFHCAASFLLTCATANVHAMSKGTKSKTANLLTALKKREVRTRAAIEGWNTRIHRQLAQRMLQEQAAVQMATLAHDLCKREIIERNNITRLYELALKNLEAERCCQVCLDSYGNDSPPFPSLCGCEGKFCHSCAEKILATDTPSCPFCRQLIDTTEQPLTTGNLHLAQNMLGHTEHEINSEASHTATSDTSNGRSFWSEEGYDWARESDSTSQASSGGILYPSDDGQF